MEWCATVAGHVALDRLRGGGGGRRGREARASRRIGPRYDSA